MSDPLDTIDVADTLKALLEETERQREVISSLLGRLEPDDERALRSEGRKPFDLELHLVSKTDIIRARGLDVSEGGIGVEIETPIAFMLRYKDGGRTEIRNVDLMWSKITTSGSQRLGFRLGDRLIQHD